MPSLLQSGRIFAPASHLDTTGDVLIDQSPGTIREISTRRIRHPSDRLLGQTRLLSFADILARFPRAGDIITETIANGTAAAMHYNSCSLS